MLFYRAGSLHAIAVLARRERDVQPLYLPCPRCGVDYVTTSPKRRPAHGLPDVWRYPEVQQAFDDADDLLMLECPDRAYRFEV
jgi:hypothetical protein